MEAGGGARGDGVQRLMPLRKRSQARRLALQALCVREQVGEAFDSALGEFLNDEEVLRDLDVDTPPPAELVGFAAQLVRGTWALRAELDRRLQQRSPRWTLERMSPVDRNILRLGLYELLESREVAPEVVISEAVELAAQFGDAHAPGFVNAVLDGLRRELHLGGGGSPEPPSHPEPDDAAPGES